MSGIRTLGVDLSSQRRDTAACLVEWDAGRARIRRLESGLTNADLLPLMKEVAVVGLDAPFGWPDDFREAIARWADGGAWPLTWDDKKGSPTLRLRATDEWVQGETGKQPLSVSSDRIGVTAWRAAALLHAFCAETQEGLDRVRGRVREVYPGAALIAWRLLGLREPSSYKRDEDVRAKLVSALADRERLELAEYASDLRVNDHKFDAFVSALVARASMSEAWCHAPPAGISMDRLRREGWIWIPRLGSLGQLSLDPPG